MPLVEVVRLVANDEFSRLRVLADRQGGFYSKYARTGVPRGFLFEKRGDAEAFIAAASGTGQPARTQAESSVSNLGHAYQVGGEWFGDTNFVQALGRSGFLLEHMGGGDFQAKSANGTITAYVASAEKKSPEQVGRLHSLDHTGGEDALEKTIADMEHAGAIEILGPWDAWPAPARRPTGEILNEIVKNIRKELETRTRTGGDDQRLIELTLACEKDGWPAGMPVGWVNIHPATPTP